MGPEQITNRKIHYTEIYASPNTAFTSLIDVILQGEGRAGDRGGSKEPELSMTFPVSYVSINS